MSKKKYILATGITGDLGKELVKAILATHPDCIIAGPSRDEKKFADVHAVLTPEESKRLHLFVDDISSDADKSLLLLKVEKLIGNRPEYVIDGAGAYKSDKKIQEEGSESYERMRAVNTSGIAIVDAMLELAQKDGRPFTVCFIGSTGAVGEFVNLGFNGTHKYGETKAKSLRHYLELAKTIPLLKLRALHPGTFEGTLAQSIANEYGQTSALTAKKVAETAEKVFFDQSDDKIIQKIIASEEYFAWENEWKNKESYITSKMGLSSTGIEKVKVDGINAKTIYAEITA